MFSRGDGCWQCLFCDAVSVLLWVWPGCCLGAADLCARAVVAAIACLAMQPDAVVGAGQGAVVSASQGAVECAQGAALGCPKLSHYRGRDHKRWLGWFLVSTFPWTSHPFAWHELLRSTCRYATHVLRSCPSSSMSGWWGKGLGAKATLGTPKGRAQRTPCSAALGLPTRPLWGWRATKGPGSSPPPRLYEHAPLGAVFWSVFPCKPPHTQSTLQSPRVDGACERVSTRNRECIFMPLLVRSSVCLLARWLAGSLACWLGLLACWLAGLLACWLKVDGGTFRARCIICFVGSSGTSAVYFFGKGVDPPHVYHCRVAQNLETVTKTQMTKVETWPKGSS